MRGGGLAPIIAAINIRIQCGRGFRGLLWPFACLWVFSGVALGQTATNITGLYNTGEKTSGYSLVAAGTQVQSSASAPTTSSGWYVSYASTNGGTNTSTTYEGDAYAMSASSVSNSGYTSNASTAEWIVAPGASTSTSGSSVNTGGNYLPGNGSSGSNEGIYVYTLAFTITGSGAAGTKVTSAMTVDLTLAADDNYTVYVNPKGYNVDPTNAPSTYTASASASLTTSAWSNTTGITLGNSGSYNNSTFYIGTNYISVVVDNTNGVSGSSSSTAWNESGLLAENDYAFVGSNEVWANGGVVPEVTPWLPIAGAVILYGFFVLRRRSLAAPGTLSHA